MVSRLALGIVTLAVGFVALTLVLPELGGEDPGASRVTNPEAIQFLGDDAIGLRMPSALAATRGDLETDALGEGLHAAVSNSETMIMLPADPVSYASEETLLMVSGSPNRAEPVPLDGTTIFGTIYVFMKPEGAEKVEFWLDDPDRSGPPLQRERIAPFDLAGGGEAGANPYDTRTLAAGRHSITAVLTKTDGTSILSSASFRVIRSNEALAASSPPNESEASAASSSSSTSTTVAQASPVVVSSTNTSPTTTVKPVTTTTVKPVTTTTVKPVTTTTVKPVTTTTVKPVSGTFDAVVRPGDSIQAVVNGLPEGATVLIGSGVHVRQQVQPKSGMTFVGEPGAVMDGQGVTQHAFAAFSKVNNVTIRGLEIRNYSPSEPPLAAIQSAHVSGWLVEDCEVHRSLYAGIYVGPNSTVRDCYIHHNERIGLKAKGKGVLVANNEISFNNPNDAHDQGWEAGGLKFVETEGMIIRNNYVHDNLGPGIWADVYSIHTLIEDNVVENNTRAGIDYEISSYGVIRNNTVRFNGHEHGRIGGWMWGAGITIRGPHVEVYGNVVQGNYNGIALIQTNRGSQWDLRNITVRDNLIVNSGQNGGVRSAGPAAIFDTSGFDGNEYRYNDINARWWRWDDSAMTRDQWTSAGNDPNGIFKSS